MHMYVCMYVHMHLPSFYSGVFNHVYMYACKHACIHTCNIIRMYVHTCICPRFYSGVAPANASSSLHASVYARAVCLHLRTRWVRACEEHAIQASVPNVTSQSADVWEMRHASASLLDPPMPLLFSGRSWVPKSYTLIPLTRCWAQAPLGRSFWA